MQETLLTQRNTKNSGGFYFFIILLAVLVAMFYLSSSVFSLVKVDGASMNETLLDGDVLFDNQKRDVKHGDVVVFEYPEHGMLIKRVIGMEGDVVKCQNGNVYVKYSGDDSFTMINEPYLSVDTSDFSEFYVEDGTIFVLGDNRGISNDSRNFLKSQPVKLDYVVGVVTNKSIKYKKLTTSLFGWTFKLGDSLGGK